ncbi:Anti-sigma-K factor rskA [Pseudobythopirellula maris]|uniref:Regulator of SigK n=1 Tax=Pseudobythopirellula maris TaxID=2527991 RepID=A0A5C5ZSD7_9BACT|nr:anti-sigma factor [Pseudobythopirellula maris]TWT89965.1 Anti-sigma-K factor rskA [Pseudobythopirellula maris]
MDCNKVNEMLAGHALGALDPNEAAAVEEHLRAGCTACRYEFDRMLETVALMDEAQGPIDPPSALRDQILASIEAEAPSPALPLQSAPRRGWRDYAPYLAAAVGAVIVGAGVANWPSSEPQPTAQQVADHASRVEEWRRRVAEAEGAFQTPGTRQASFRASGAEAGLRIALFYDPLAEQLHAVVSGVTAPSPGNELRLWAHTTEGGWRSLGSLETFGSGRALAVLDVAHPPAGWTEAQITDEPPGARDKPAGEIVGLVPLAEE